MNITFRALTEKADLHALEELEAAVWSGDSVIPLHMTLTLAKFGGLFLGAYDDDTLIGFLYSFPGFTDGEPHLCSHMLGFLPEYRKRGLGVRMKWLQREEALKLGHRKITWTYDPLETVNGYLNIAKLGGVVKRYLPNCYGELNDEMNRGLPTDRFLVEWFIDSQRVEQYRVSKPPLISTEGAPSVLETDLSGDLPYPRTHRLNELSDVLLLPVPAHFQALKRADMEAAREWREVTRTLFTHYLARGYVITGVIRDQSLPLVHYVLENKQLDVILRCT
ncbi:GNAT family N-acetyltransferase [Brevibacillus sp. H7]|uniref:GNAT family N-acetyltransferase n=1 Tax=Brevibacillus sp. H7 TaxID=3349138 RepID=UPI003809AA20